MRAVPWRKAARHLALAGAGAEFLLGLSLVAWGATNGTTGLVASLPLGKSVTWNFPVSVVAILIGLKLLLLGFLNTRVWASLLYRPRRAGLRLASGALPALAALVVHPALGVVPAALLLAGAFFLVAGGVPGAEAAAAGHPLPEGAGARGDVPERGSGRDDTSVLGHLARLLPLKGRHGPSSSLPTSGPWPEG